MNSQELFSTLEQKYRLPEGYLARVYQAESSSGKNLYNEQSGAEGPFQFVPRTSRVVGLKDPYNLEESADAAARLAVQNRAYLQKKGVEEIDGRTLYLALLGRRLSPRTQGRRVRPRPSLPSSS